MRIGYLCKKRDACYYIRVLVPSSHLVLHGHEVKEELVEIQGYCTTCGGQHILEYHFFHEGEFKCPKCATVLPFDTQAWKDNIMSLIDWADIVVFQRTTDLDHLRLMKMTQDMGKPVVLEGDDDYINVPEKNPGYHYYMQRQGFVKEMFRIANGVTVTTPGLKQVYSEFNDNIAVIPNCNDIEIVDSEPQLPQATVFGADGKQVPFEQYLNARQGKTVIGWGGSPTHEDDLAIILPALKKLVRREPNLLFAMVGFVHRGMIEIIPPHQLYMFSLVPVTAYFMLYKTVNFDIGLAPVAPLKFNMGKSSNKLIEYQILNVLPVASDFVTYKKDIHRGFLASPNTETVTHLVEDPVTKIQRTDHREEGSTYGWFNAISNAIHCEDRAERILANRKYAEENYDIKAKIHLWIEFFQSVIERKT
jgi:glycosyltransferase involved in cell wall biosynthesis